MSSPPDWLNHLWPCYTCCRQIWIPRDATFGDGCPGVIAYVPVLLSLLVLFGRYALSPLWRRRPLWLRGFATEEDELGLSKRRPLLGNGNGSSSRATRRRIDGSAGEGGDDGDNNDDNNVGAVDESAVEVDVEDGVGAVTDSDNDNATDSSASSTVVGFGRRNSIANVRPVNIGGRFVSLKIQPYHLMTLALFLLSLTGIITSLTLTVAARLGPLYLTPLVPCIAVCVFLAVDRPRTLPGVVLLLYSCTLIVQLALLFGVPALSQWPLNLTWLAEMSVTGLSIGIMMAMPMRDPRMGNGRDDDRIAALFETPSKKRRSPEDNLTLWQWMTVNWMSPIIGLGATRQLHDEDVWHLPFQFQHARLYRLFHDVTGSVTARIVKVNAPDLIITSALGILDSLLSMLPIILLQQLLAAMEGPDPSVRVASTYAVFICITNITRAQAGVFSLWFTRRCYERSRGELITMIYEKTLRRKAFTFPGHFSEDDKKKGGKKRRSSVIRPRVTTGPVPC